MPPIQTKITPEETRIARAIKGIASGEYKSVAEANWACNVPYSKLYYRNKGWKCNDTNGGLNKALDPAQEEALLLYIDRCDELGRPCKHRHIEMGANSILQASGTSKVVSRAWTSRFIKHRKVRD